jgi:hypothetical protein
VLVGVGVTEGLLIDAIRAERNGATPEKNEPESSNAATVWFLEVDANS